LVFTAWVYLLGLVMGIACLPLLLGPRKTAVQAIGLWSRLVMGGLQVLIGVKIEIRGLQYRPTGPALVAAKHQGMFDIMPPFVLLTGPGFIMKKELMVIPIFGWFSAKAGMISIDREGGAATLRSMTAAAKALFAEQRQVVIFPEGTRKAPGEAPEYKIGVAGLYRELEVPCAPVATNSGLIWPAHGIVRYPGVLIYEFLPPIPPGLKRGEFMRRLQSEIETASAALLAEARPPAAPLRSATAP
jgi:1-acyl-sn-glycerol-3-phosphate acyltransferase